jgi:hypothetical protein
VVMRADDITMRYNGRDLDSVYFYAYFYPD